MTPQLSKSSRVQPNLQTLSCTFFSTSTVSFWILLTCEQRIFEITHRTLPALLNTTFIILSPFITTIYDWWWSPFHLIFTYLIPLIPIFYAVDGYVSCARVRTAQETWNLLPRRPGLTVEEWEQKNGWRLRSGHQVVLPPFGTLYWYSGVKKEAE